MSVAKPLLTILIPVYNEENTLKEILNRTTVLPIGPYELIVVNDGSMDESPEIIQKFIDNFTSKTVKITLINHKINRGKGATIKTALSAAKGTYFIIQDADLEYDPADITKLINYASKKNLDVVYGSRFLGKIVDMPKPNYIANKTYNILLRLMYQTEITDMHTCYKLVKTSLLRDQNMTSNGFGYASELVSKLLTGGYRINELPINFYGRNKREGKKINYKDGFECIRDLLIYRYKRKLK